MLMFLCSLLLLVRGRGEGRCWSILQCAFCTHKFWGGGEKECLLCAYIASGKFEGIEREERDIFSSFRNPALFCKQCPVPEPSSLTKERGREGEKEREKEMVALFDYPMKGWMTPFMCCLLCCISPLQEFQSVKGEEKPRVQLCTPNGKSLAQDV